MNVIGMLEAQSTQRAVVEGFYVNEKSTDTSWDRFVTQHFNHCATAVIIVNVTYEKLRYLRLGLFRLC